MKRIVTGNHVVDWVAKKTNEFGNFGAAAGIGIEDGELRAGVVFNEYNGASMCIHVASDGSRAWMNRELLWYVFHYAFNEAKVNLLIGLVGEGNKQARRFDEHLGFVLEHEIPDAHPTGKLLIYRMRREECRFLNMRRNRNEYKEAA
jgi:RimJ/RimL family protein N-acetyltransferase